MFRKGPKTYKDFQSILIASKTQILSFCEDLIFHSFVVQNVTYLGKPSSLGFDYKVSIGHTCRLGLLTPLALWSLSAINKSTQSRSVDMLFANIAVSQALARKQQGQS